MRRILIVDDDPQVRQAIGDWLTRHGFWVSTADRGFGGLAALDSATFDLMIVDVLMPNLRGFESVRIFHRRAPEIPLIAISGHAFSDADPSGSDFLKLASRLGATRCLRKPFKPATLLDIIDDCLSEAEPHRRHVEGLGRVANALSDGQVVPELVDKIPGRHVAGQNERSSLTAGQ